MLEHLGDTSPDDERRVKAVLILANPVIGLDLLRDYQRWLATRAGDPAPEDNPVPVVDYSKLLPAVVVYVHLYGEADNAGVPASRAAAQ